MSHSTIAYLAAGEYEAGATICETAIAESPNESQPYWYLGLFRLLQGNESEAQAVWLAALTALDPTEMDAAIHTLLEILQLEGERQLATGNAQQAERIYRQAIELDATQPLFFLQLGLATSLQGKLDEAIESWQIAIQLQPNCTEAYIQQGEVFFKLEQWREAIDAYRHAIDLQPSVELHHRLGICLGQQNLWQDAIHHLTQAIAHQPNLAAAHSDRGWAWLQLHHWQQATQDFQAALQIHSAYAQTYFNWVNQLQQRHLPCAELLLRNATYLQQLCVNSQQAWQQWQDNTPTIAPTLPIVNETGSAPPIGYILDTKTWAASQPDVHYIPLDPVSMLQLRPPKTCDRSLHFSFRLASEIPLPKTFVVTIPNGRFWLKADQSSTAIITPSNQLLGDVSPEFPLLTPGHPDKHPQYHSILRMSELPAIQTIPGTVAILAGLTNNMYFHWLFDCLPRFDLLVRSQIDIQSIDYFLVSSKYAFQQETLKRLQIPESKILETNHHLHIQATQLIIPSFPSSPAWMTKRVCSWLRDLMLSDNQPLSERIRVYITRQQTTNRRIINEVELIEFLQSLGFTAIALETLSIQEQARLLAAADVVVSAHGGGLTNLTFCRSNTTVIELFSPNFVYPCYWLVSNLLDLNYYYLTGTTPDGYFLHQQIYANPRTEDMLINLDELRNLLQLAGVTP